MRFDDVPHNKSERQNISTCCLQYVWFSVVEKLEAVLSTAGDDDAAFLCECVKVEMDTAKPKKKCHIFL